MQYKRTIIKSSILSFIAIQTYGCQDQAARQVGGGLVGGGTGAIVGAQIGAGTGQLVAVAVGTLLGAFIGTEIGANIREGDHAYADAAAQQAFRSGQSTSWNNPSTSHKGKIDVGPRYYQKGTYYRNYTQKIYIDGQEEIAHGKACKKPDGSWIICY